VPAADERSDGAIGEAVMHTAVNECSDGDEVELPAVDGGMLNDGDDGKVKIQAAADGDLDELIGEIVMQTVVKECSAGDKVELPAVDGGMVNDGDDGKVKIQAAADGEIGGVVSEVKTPTSSRGCKRLSAGSTDDGLLTAKHAKTVYIVEALLDERKVGRVTEYLVKWRDFDNTYNSWEPRRNFRDKRIIDIWNKSGKKIKS